MTRKKVLQLATSIGIMAAAVPVVGAIAAPAPQAPAAPAAAVAPAALPNGAGDSAPTLTTLNYERMLEDSLQKSLAAYLGNGQFVLQVRVGLTEPAPQAQAPLPTANYAQPAPEPDDSLLDPEVTQEAAPPLPGLGGVNAEERAAAPRRVRRAPNPPVAPQPQAPVVSAPQAPHIDRIRISLVLPSSLKPADEDYVKNLVFQKADLNFARGDTLDIARRDFPGMAAATGAATPGSNPVPPWAWLLLGVVGAGGVAVALSLLRPKPVPAPAPVPMMPMADPNPNTKAAEAILASLEASKTQDALPVRQDLMVMLLEQPEAGERFIRKVMGEEEGLTKASIVTKAIGLSVARRLFQNLSTQEWKAIELASLDLKDVSRDDQRTVMEEAFYAMLRDRAENREDDKSSPFAFLNKLDESQLMYLMEDEGPRVQALVLSQLSPDRAVGLMRLKTPAEQGAIAAAMGDLHLLPMTSFLDLASHLSEKATKAPSFQTSVTNGLGLLVNLLDHSDRATEQGILSGLSSQNPQLLAQVRENYLTFDDLARVPREVLKDALREVEKETLAEALRDAPEAVRDAVIGALTDRARRIVEDSLSMPSPSGTDSAQVDATRKDLVARVRQLISAGRFSMREILAGKEEA